MQNVAIKLEHSAAYRNSNGIHHILQPLSSNQIQYMNKVTDSQYKVEH